MKRLAPGLLLPALLLAACGESPTAITTTPPSTTPPGTSTPVPTPKTTGQLYEVQFRHIGGADATSTVAPISGGLGAQALRSIGESQLGFTLVTVDTFVLGGKRYIRAVYDVKNNTGASIDHLTLVPINTDPDPNATTPATVTPTYGSTYFNSLTRFDGSDASGRATDITPIAGRIYSTAARQDVDDPDATPYVPLDTSTLTPTAPAGLVVASRASSGWRTTAPLAAGATTAVTFAVSVAGSSPQTDPFNFNLVVAGSDDGNPPP